MWIIDATIGAAIDKQNTLVSPNKGYFIHTHYRMPPSLVQLIGIPV